MVSTVSSVKVRKAGSITYISFMCLQNTMLRPEVKFNFIPNHEKLCFCLGGDFLVHLKLYANLTAGQEAMLIMTFFSLSYNMNTDKPVLELNELGLQNTINTAKWFKQSFSSMHITSNGCKK